MSNRCGCVGRFGTKIHAMHERDDADRHVDEEDPLPSEAVHEQAAGERADERRDTRRRSPQSHRRAAAVGREGPGDDRHRLRRHEGAPSPCTARAMISSSRVPERPHTSEASVKTTSPIR